MENERRYAYVYGVGDDPSQAIDTIDRYLPANYEVVGTGHGRDGRRFVIISGLDRAGWTFDDYVEPRLASGLYFAEERTVSQIRTVEITNVGAPPHDVHAIEFYYDPDLEGWRATHGIDGQYDIAIFEQNGHGSIIWYHAMILEGIPGVWYSGPSGEPGNAPETVEHELEPPNDNHFESFEHAVFAAAAWVDARDVETIVADEQIDAGLIETGP